MQSGNGDLLDVRLERVGDRGGLVALAGELDLSTIPKLEGTLLDQVRTQPAVIVDLTQLAFIDSSGIGILIEAFQAANGGAMYTVVADGSQVERVFTIAGIGSALPVFRSRNEAIDALPPA